MKNLIGMTDFMLGDEWEGLDESNFIMLMEYAKFLKQPLELWMFDKDDERCLFEGCGLMDNWCLQFEDGTLFCNVEALKDYKIEDLIQYDLQITQTALKQIGL